MVKTLHFQFLQRVLEANLTLESLPEIVLQLNEISSVRSAHAFRLYRWTNKDG
jgi:hypothetical protein